MVDSVKAVTAVMCDRLGTTETMSTMSAAIYQHTTQQMNFDSKYFLLGVISNLT